MNIGCTDILLTDFSMHHGIGHIAGYPSPPQTSDLGTYPLLLISGGHHCRPVQTCSLEDLPPPVLKSSGGHQNTYGCQVGVTHPTGMLSCWKRVLLVTALS